MAIESRIILLHTFPNQIWKKQKEREYEGRIFTTKVWESQGLFAGAYEVT